MMDNPPKTNGLSRADWGRYGGTNTPRCFTCGHKAEAVVSLTATEIGGKTGQHITREKVYYCHTHGILSYGEALRRLHGGATK